MPSLIQSRDGRANEIDYSPIIAAPDNGGKIMMEKKASDGRKENRKRVKNTEEGSG